MTAIRTSHERRVERARALRRTLLADRLLAICVVVAVAWLVLYALATLLTLGSAHAGLIVGDGVYLVPEAPLPLLLGFVAYRSHGRRRAFWLLLASYALLTFVGDATWSVYEMSGSDVPPFSDVAFLSAYAFALPAIVVAIPTSWTRLARSLLDATVIALALGAIGWRLLIGPLAHEHAPSFPDLAYPALDVAVVVLLLTLAIA